MVKKLDLNTKSYRTLPTAQETPSDNRILLEQIRPDPQQPRNLLPRDLLESLWGGASPLEVAQMWRDWYGAGQLDVTQRTTYEKLIELAHSIQTQGLINPITVRPAPDRALSGAGYWIVTGERRYWAHVLLLSQGKLADETIHAITTHEGANIRAHQLMENLMREGINAVELAMGVWALRYEMSKVSMPPEDDVALGRHPNPKELVPWKDVEAVMGWSRQHRSRITAVLDRLPVEAQRIVSDHHLSEKMIRPILRQLKGKPDLQVQTLRQIVIWKQVDATEDGPGRRMIASVKELIEQLLAQDGKLPVKSDVANRGTRFAKMVSSNVKFLGRLDETQMQEMLQELSRFDNRDGVKQDLKSLQAFIEQALGMLD